MADIKKIQINGTNYDIAAIKLADARTISLTGLIQGSGTFDGTADLSITTAVASDDVFVLNCGSSTVNI